MDAMELMEGIEFIPDKDYNLLWYYDHTVVFASVVTLYTTTAVISRPIIITKTYQQVPTQ